MTSPLTSGNQDSWRHQVPPRRWFSVNWSMFHGTDYYGALHVASRYCGKSHIPFPSVDMWQHGCFMPWQQVHPLLITYASPPSYRCWVAREEQADYLRRNGYADVTAVGLPIVYVDPQPANRIPDSLLVMPIHSSTGTKIDHDFLTYAKQISSLRDRFASIVACVSPHCIEKGYWAPQFESLGIDVIAGAAVYDSNSLTRMQTLFSMFESVTTNGFGSHVAYALYFGAKVSIWGDEVMVKREDILGDKTWAALPVDALEMAFGHETRQLRDEAVKPLHVIPWEGIQNQSWGAEMIGANNKLSPSEMEQYLFSPDKWQGLSFGRKYEWISMKLKDAVVLQGSRVKRVFGSWMGRATEEGVS